MGVRVKALPSRDVSPLTLPSPRRGEGYYFSSQVPTHTKARRAKFFSGFFKSFLYLPETRLAGLPLDGADAVLCSKKM